MISRKAKRFLKCGEEAHKHNVKSVLVRTAACGVNSGCWNMNDEPSRRRRKGDGMMNRHSATNSGYDAV